MSVAINSTNFPDAKFRAYISTYFDLDHDNSLSDAEIANATAIRITDSELASLQGISYFTNLQALQIQNAVIQSIDLSSNTGLTSLQLTNTSGLSTLTGLSNLTNLKSLTLVHTSLASLDVSALTLLEALNCSACSVTSLDVSHNANLKKLIIESSLITSINLRNNPLIEYFSAERSANFATLILPENCVINTLCLYASGITSLDLSGLSSLRVLEIVQTSVSSVDLRDCPKLSYLFDNIAPSNLDPLLITYTSNGEEWAIWADSDVNLITDNIRITQQPQDSTADVGENASFTVAAVGADLSYQWQVKTGENTSWADLSGKTSTSLVVEASSSNDGYKYRCFISNTEKRVYSEEATLHSMYAPIITTQPQNVTVVNGQNATFTVVAQGNGLTYQWEVYENSSWVPIQNANSTSLELLSSSVLDGKQYHCKIQNGSGTTTSNTVTLTVTVDTSISLPTIITQPTSVVVSEGSDATFSIVADGDGLLYQWQINTDDTWQNISGANSSQYSVVAVGSLGGSIYRCVVSNAAGTVYTNTAVLNISSGEYVSTPRIIIQPKNITTEVGEVIFFWIRADGGSLNYQWQTQNDGSWYDVTGAIGNTYTFTARTELHGKKYRCIVSNTAGSIISNVVTLSLQAEIDVSFYGYHSIIISGKNTYGEWHMYPTSRPHVAPPEVKTSYVDIPGANGGLDYTELLNGEPKYGYRKGSWEFLLIPQDEWASVYRSLVDYLHGKQHTIILEDDPNYIYTGRLSVNQWQSAAHNSLITIDYILDPFPRNISGEEEEAQDAADLDAASRLLLKEENEGLVIALINGSASLIYPSMLFEDGDNISY